MYLALNANNNDQVQYIHKNKTTGTTSKISGGVHENKMWKALKSAILQTMKYPLPDTTLNEK